MSKYSLLVASASLSLATMLTGCGGGGGSGGVNSTPTPPSGSTNPPTTPTTPTTPATPPSSINYDDAEYRRSTAAFASHAIEAYKDGATGAGVKIAILDSGVTNVMGEFNGRIDSASRDMAGSRGYTDGAGHGTAVAAVAAAARNGNEIMGVAFDATVLALRTDDPGSCPQACNHFHGVLASAVDYARTNGAKVINLSLGGDAMSKALRSAVNRATSAGIIVVVSAGNEGSAEPDAFAQVASSGDARGLVIIAGAHNINGVISSFSDRAGSLGQYYLTASGEGVRSFDHTGTAFSYSGTSFAAPTISGSVALLAQAFPNLTASQIVNLLMTTADDAGTPGIDSIYGRGLLNLTRAFQPQGATSLAGSAVPVSLTDNGTISSAMGDSGTTTGQAVVLDSYQRAYTFNFGTTIRRTGIDTPLFSAIGRTTRRNSFDLAGLSVALSFAGGGVHGAHAERWSGLDTQAFAHQQSTRAKATGGTFRMTLTKDTSAVAAFGERLSAGSDAGASWLVAHEPQSMRGLQAQQNVGLGVIHRLGRLTLTATAETGEIERLRPTDKTDGYHMLSLRADRSFGALSLGAALGMMREESSLLGARLSPMLGGQGATTRLADVDVRLDLGDGWALDGQWRQAWTVADRGGALVKGQLTSNAFAFDLVRTGRQSRFGLRIAQPLRVAGGTYRLNLPVSYDYATTSATYGLNEIDFSPKGHELNVEANYGRTLGAGWIDANLFLRRDPGNVAANPTDIGTAIRFTLGF